jgi:hypothetical protein
LGEWELSDLYDLLNLAAYGRYRAMVSAGTFPYIPTGVDTAGVFYYPGVRW